MLATLYKKRVLRFLFLLFLLPLLPVSCSIEPQFLKEHLEGRYIMSDKRTVARGPEKGEVFLGGEFALSVSDDLSRVYMDGKWTTGGRLLTLVLKLDPATVTDEDGNSVTYTFFKVEAHSELYQITGFYNVTGQVKNSDGETEPYEASGYFDARKLK